MGDQTGRFLVAYDVAEQGALRATTSSNARAIWESARRCLSKAREEYIHPGRDEKVFSSWNGLMLAAFAGAARVLDRDGDYAHLIDRLLELYQTTFDPRWYTAAWELAEAMIEHFGVPNV